MRGGYYDVLVRACARYGGQVGMRHYVRGEHRVYTYSELYGVGEYMSQMLQLLHCRHGTVGIVTERNPLVPCVIAAVHKNSTTFMFLDPSKDNSRIIESINFETIICLHEIERPCNVMEKKPDKEICVFDIIVKFYKLNSLRKVPNEFTNDYSYIVQTSGSTGEPKQINVPIQCLQPNINDLSQIFNMSRSDVIYMSSPLTFDPAMVELMLACDSGASMLVAPPDADVLFPSHPSPHALTVWQTTPSIFFQFSKTDISTKILSACSKLRVLAFGGEPMNHIRQLKKLKAEGNETRVYCLYGVTEMSCWASVAELPLDTIPDDWEVPLGNCLSETEMRVSFFNNESKLGNILIGSNSRKCNILNKYTPQIEFMGKSWIETGDVGEVSNGTIYFRGRMDEVIKRFGHKVNLQLIEKAAMLCSRVKSCSCVWLPDPRSIILYYTSDLLFSDELQLFLNSQLDHAHWPDKIVRIESLPLNRHGKVCKKNLASKYRAEPSTDSLEFLKFFIMNEIRSSLKHKFTYEEIKDQNYFSIGGTSFLAVTLCNNLAQAYPQLNQTIVSSLLSRKKTIENFIVMVRQGLSNDPNLPIPKLAPPSLAKLDKKPKPLKKQIKIEKLWSFNTGKCVDATPTVVTTTSEMSYVVVGSHSGKVVVLNAANGSAVGILELNSRVEAPVLCYQHGMDTYGVVGTYDGTIVCFAVSDCAIAWKININSMIKSKATFVEGLLYVASYDGNLRCIDFATGRIKHVISVEHGISADLVTAAGKTVLVGTLSGACLAFSANENALQWRHDLASPIFARPYLYHQDERVIFAEVDGIVHCLCAEKGLPLWKFDGANGNIFSSFSLKYNMISGWDLLFGCHDFSLYCLNIQQDNVKLKWKTSMMAPIYSTPCYFLESYVLAASNNGKLSVMDSETGIITLTYDFPGEVFSSPVTLNKQIYIGCRDDCVYSLQCEELN